MDADRWDEQVGSVAEEATRLLESLRRNAEAGRSATEETSGTVAASATDAADAAADPDAGASAADAGGPTPSPHDPLCTWCPLCRGASVIRSLSPETLTRLADLAGLAATVLAELATSRGPDEGGAPRADRRDAPARGATRRAATPPRRTQPAPSAPILVRDADDPQEAPRG